MRTKNASWRWCVADPASEGKAKLKGEEGDSSSVRRMLRASSRTILRPTRKASAQLLDGVVLLLPNLYLGLKGSEGRSATGKLQNPWLVEDDELLNKVAARKAPAVSSPFSCLDLLYRDDTARTRPTQNGDDETARSKSGGLKVQFHPTATAMGPEPWLVEDY
ncbi:hypothetical protein PIB30_069289 [Stylosanthes scabra]|uniref:Uncharacterized protein n=1 Tax=Stylosanthes scabra TaxID=79078 RepID=A0ABU6ZLW9_9FABA|nr:hypothetical protein [Stylosanthes scabra]